MHRHLGHRGAHLHDESLTRAASPPTARAATPPTARAAGISLCGLRSLGRVATARWGRDGAVEAPAGWEAVPQEACVLERNLPAHWLGLSDARMRVQKCNMFSHRRNVLDGQNVQIEFQAKKKINWILSILLKSHGGGRATWQTFNTRPPGAAGRGPGGFCPSCSQTVTGEATGMCPPRLLLLCWHQGLPAFQPCPSVIITIFVADLHGTFWIFLLCTGEGGAGLVNQAWRGGC